MKKNILQFVLSLFILSGCSDSTKIRYTGPKEQINSDRALDKFTEKLCEEHNLRYITRGGGSIVGFPESQWNLSLISQKMMREEEAIELMKTLSKNLFHEVQTNKSHFNLLYYINDLGYSNSFDLKSLKIQPFMIGIKLTFWDDQMERPARPYVAQIRYVNQKILIYYSDRETQKLSKPTELLFSL